MASPQSIPHQQQQPPSALASPPSLISLPHTGPDTEEVDYDDEKGYTSTNPRSAFYSHPPTRTSLEIRKSESRVNVASTSLPSSSSSLPLPRPPPLSTTKGSSHLRSSSGDVPDDDDDDDDDLESGRKKVGGTRLQNLKSQLNPNGSAGTGQGGGRCKHSHRTRQRSRQNLTGTIRGSRACAPYRRLSRHQKWAVQILLALLVVGLGVGLGVGISRAVGAGVWRSNNSSYEIPPEKGHKEDGG